MEKDSNIMTSGPSATWPYHREKAEGHSETSGSDEVKHPHHYTQGKIEVWDAITGLELGYLEGNVLKYIARWKHKGGLKDLEKARAYIDKLIAVNS